MQPQNGTQSQPTRRQFVKTSTAAAAAGASSLVVPRGAYAAENNTIKIGLVGCGGRGSGAAVNACHADEHTVLWAVCDLFLDRLTDALAGLKQELNGQQGAKGQVLNQVDVPKERQFIGFDGYKGVIESCDVVLLATTPHFRPMQLEAVIRAGKHCFCEKPVAVDPTGVRRVLEVAKLAKEKNLSLVSGLCYRYDQSKIDVINKIHDGAVGDIRALEHNYLTGGLWTRPRQPKWSDMEFQIRNWLYFYWLSGDHIVEQHIHSLDKMMWIMKDVPPTRVIATGGRIQRTAPQYGNVYDHFNTIFEWDEKGQKAPKTRAFTNCRQYVNCNGDVSDWVYGSDGIASVQADAPFITGKNPAKIRPSKINMYDAEHIALFKSIRKNQPINNGVYMSQSTLAAIMARMSAYSGKVITWAEAMHDQTSYTMPKYAFGPHAVDPVVVPGEANKVGAPPVHV